MEETVASSSELEKRPAVDPHEEPSHEWGWHGSLPGAVRWGGILSAVFLFLMLVFRNHHGNTENIYLIVTIVVIVGGLVWDAARKRTSWRR
ncbi:hypothetical protein UK23_06800 [Lentzea aerocolonigenes]|uniref:DUF2631 domain-containing protein n=1 Tax=Lentzea aerocolonigenes TaxID=68170 RepID=A0A0F0HCT5_LENAE|nr:hypothetical protein UK23_06800 [Lentzea aerocolonigenes]